ncbi:MAG: hypothetical protein JW841_15435 [Deltaproteobacteria bacterium]|nr:hypothetical protein [Deltaproteobacteria bacterium]
MTTSGSAAAAQGAVDAAMKRIDNISSRITSITEAMAVIQEAIAILQQELGALKPPNPNNYYKTEQHTEGTPPNEHTVNVRVFDSAAYSAALAVYDHEVARLQSQIQSKQNELAQKESELSRAQNDLAQAQNELAHAQQELERALHDDAQKLHEAQERYAEAQRQMQEMQAEALQAQAEAQKAQDELTQANAQLQQIRDNYTENAAERARHPEACAQQDYARAMTASNAASADLQTAANYLPRLQDGELAPPRLSLSAEDFAELTPRIDGLNNEVYARSTGLLTRYGEGGSTNIPTTAGVQMIDAWKAAGFSEQEIQTALTNMVGPTAAQQMLSADAVSGGYIDGYTGTLGVLNTNPLFVSIAGGDGIPMSEGCNGASVRDVELTLFSLHVWGPFGPPNASVAADSYQYDQTTEAAVRAFQEQYMRTNRPAQYQYLQDNNLLGTVDSTTLLAMDQAKQDGWQGAWMPGSTGQGAILDANFDETDAAFVPADTTGTVNRVRVSDPPENPRVNPSDLPPDIAYMNMDDAMDYVYNDAYQSVIGNNTELYSYNDLARLRTQASTLATQQVNNFLTIASRGITANSIAEYNTVAASQRTIDISQLSQDEQYDYFQNLVNDRGGTFRMGEGEVNIIGVRGMQNGVTVPNTGNQYNDTIYVVVMQNGEKHVYPFTGSVEPGVWNEQNHGSYGYTMREPEYYASGRYKVNEDGTVAVNPASENQGILALSDGYYQNAFSLDTTDTTRGDNSGYILAQTKPLVVNVDKWGVNGDTNGTIDSGERDERYAPSWWDIWFHQSGDGAQVGHSSAGCQVIQGTEEFNQFMQLVRNDPGRNAGFSYLLVSGTELPPPPLPIDQPQ